MKSGTQHSTQLLMEVEEIPPTSSVASREEACGRVATLLMRTTTDEKLIPIYRGKQVRVGRKPICEEVVLHSVVSNLHFTVYVVMFDDASQPLVYCWDNSRNGTYHNGRIIGTGNRVLLTDGDLIEIRHACSFMFYQTNLTANVPIDSILEADRAVMENYNISQRIIGRGTFGKVFLAVDKKTQKQLACKVIETGGSKSRMTKARTEVAILERLCHPNVVTVYDYHIIQDRIYILEDLITGGDLFSYLVKGDVLRPVPEAEALVIVFQILKALEYLHSKNVAHRDLKLDNILLVSQQAGSRIVLVDFGISKYVDGQRRMTTVVGTPEFSAPEVGFADVHKGRSRRGYDIKCDIWSLGVVLHILLSGISPFYDTSEKPSKIARNARECQLNMTGPAWRHISLNAKDLVSQLIAVDPEERLSVTQCLSHPWISMHMADLQTIYDTKITADWKVPGHKVAENDSMSGVYRFVNGTDGV
ncbi:kinase-like domain-containing protein [Lipomyces arxii]|uniref:kinase-like domain-containing protein n=1 Tax=Lipomyces arxii TaxID=56418 RepID=UPI0034CDF244